MVMGDPTSSNISASTLSCVLLFIALCLQQPHSCTANNTMTEHSGLRRTVLSIGSGVASGLIAAILMALVLKCVVRYISTTPILKGPVIFSPKIDPNALQSALSAENHSLGSNYYRAVLDNGLAIAIKRLEPFASPPDNSTKRRIQQELELLGGLRDRNLMSLHAYVREHDRVSLVYDYIPGGSLEDAMNRVRENELQLGWEIRLRIAVGVVKGLQLLHSYVPQILHCNLKPTNVMLDAQFEPRLADFALADLVTPKTCAYAAPESLENGRYSEKSDIYSFGMILGVLLTGREGREGLGQWVRQLQEAGEAGEALDKSIVAEEAEQDEMLMALRVAVICLSHDPTQRPSCDELVHMLTQLHSF